MPDNLKHCPICFGKVRRVHRRFSDRILSIVAPVHRYRCRNPHCDWTGNIYDTGAMKAKNKSVHGMTLWILVAATALFMGTCSIKFIEKIAAGSGSADASD